MLFFASEFTQEILILGLSIERRLKFFNAMMNLGKKKCVVIQKFRNFFTVTASVRALLFSIKIG